MTMQPAAAAFGAYSRETSPPAENRPSLRALEVEGGHVDDRDVPAAKFHALAERAAAGERQQLGHREVALLEHLIIVSPTRPVAPSTATLKPFEVSFFRVIG